MADEAFALSPISARATQPREEDYDAISEAFMETSRGRWFLGEYAKRNRNSDTRMVLDAVSRIEQSLAAQKQPELDSGLAEALAAISGAVVQAEAAAAAAIDNLALEEALAPVRKGARVIKEIAWRWREIGADGRICDLIDSQVSAIEGACGQISSADPKTALSAAFDLIKERIDEFGDGDTTTRDHAGEDVPQAAPPAPTEEMLAAIVETVEAAASPTDNPETTIGVSAGPHETAVATDEAETMTAEVAELAPEVAEVTTGIGEAASEAADLTAEAADAHDDAVLDMVALEMAAVDPYDSDEPSDTEADEIHAWDAPPVDREVVAQNSEPMAAVMAPGIHASLEGSPGPRVEPSVEPTAELSLGSALIANGILGKPRTTQSDPLAPIQRMSQTEKIALFS
jgi:hypothetical protein